MKLECFIELLRAVVAAKEEIPIWTVPTDQQTYDLGVRNGKIRTAKFLLAKIAEYVD